MKDKIYIVILNHKGWKDTIECLESVFKLNSVTFQVLLVDNSPTLESVNNIEKWAIGEINFEIETNFNKLIFPLIDKPLDYKIISEDDSKLQFFDHSLIIIKTNHNRGFAAGNNIALNYAMRRNDYKFCWLLNNDTVVEPDSLRNQLIFLSENPFKIGILGSVLVN